MLEDRDDGPLLAVAVTPLGTRGYLGYRAALAAALTTLLTVYGIALLLPGVTPAIAVLLVLLIAAESVLAAAILPSVARNKVEGLAVTKLTNLTAIVPLAALLPRPLALSVRHHTQLLAGRAAAGAARRRDSSAAYRHSGHSHPRRSRGPADLALQALERDAEAADFSG